MLSMMTIARQKIVQTSFATLFIFLIILAAGKLRRSYNRRYNEPWHTNDIWHCGLACASTAPHSTKSSFASSAWDVHLQAMNTYWKFAFSMYRTGTRFEVWRHFFDFVLYILKELQSRNDKSCAGMVNQFRANEILVHCVLPLYTYNIVVIVGWHILFTLPANLLLKLAFSLHCNGSGEMFGCSHSSPKCTVVNQDHWPVIKSAWSPSLAVGRHAG